MAPAQAHGLELGAETRNFLTTSLCIPFKFFACIFDISCVCICMYMYMYVYLIVNFFLCTYSCLWCWDSWFKLDIVFTCAGTPLDSHTGNGSDFDFLCPSL